MERLHDHGSGQLGHRPPVIRRGLALLLPVLAAPLVAALSPAPRAHAQGPTFYGVSNQSPDRAGSLTAGDLDRMRRGGVGTLRFLISWRDVETSPGAYRWGGPDLMIGHAAARGIRALPYVHGHPPAHLRNPPTRARDRRAFRRLMRAMVGRYGPGGAYWRGPYLVQHPGARPRPVRAWQIFNEQNGRFFWGGKPSPRAYGRLVKAGARGIRSEHRRAEVVLGGMFATPSGRPSIVSWRYLRGLYRVKGIKRAFDTVAAHPYAPNLRGIRIQMRRLRKVMRRNGDARKRIRVTEIGWGSQRTGHPLTKTPKGQASLLRKSFRMFARQRGRRGWNVGGVNWFSWQDGDGCPICASSGLVAGPPGKRRPKPSWAAFQRLAR